MEVSGLTSVRGLELSSLGSLGCQQRQQRWWRHMQESCEHHLLLEIAVPLAAPSVSSLRSTEH